MSHKMYAVAKAEEIESEAGLRDPDKARSPLEAFYRLLAGLIVITALAIIFLLFF